MRLLVMPLVIFIEKEIGAKISFNSIINGFRGSKGHSSHSILIHGLSNALINFYFLVVGLLRTPEYCVLYWMLFGPLNSLKPGTLKFQNLFFMLWPPRV